MFALTPALPFAAVHAHHCPCIHIWSHPPHRPRSQLFTPHPNSPIHSCLHPSFRSFTAVYPDPFRSQLGLSLESVTEDMLGRAQRVAVSKERTTMIATGLHAAAVAERIKQVQSN